MSWQDILLLDAGAIKDIEWWIAAISNWNGRAVSTNIPDAQLITDASSIAWGAVLKSEQIQEAQGLWDNTMSNRSSNARELMAVLLGLHSFEKSVCNKNLQILSDNIVAVHGGYSTTER